MARAKKKEEPAHEQPWQRYFAMQSTPEEKAAARAEVEKDIERARREGVYERLLELEGSNSRGVNLEEVPTEQPWQRYFATQLTPAQKAAGRETMRKLAERAARDGVYERLLKLEGKVHLELDLDELREDRD